jgi:hypothetical protein
VIVSKQRSRGPVRSHRRDWDYPVLSILSRQQQHFSPPLICLALLNDLTKVLCGLSGPSNTTPLTDDRGTFRDVLIRKQTIAGDIANTYSHGLAIRNARRGIIYSPCASLKMNIAALYVAGIGRWERWFAMCTTSRVAPHILEPVMIT